MYLVYYRSTRNNTVTFQCIYNPVLMINDINSTKYAIFNPKITMELNQAGSFVFTLPVGNIAYDNIRRLTDEILVYRQVFVDNMYIMNAVDPGDIYDEDIGYTPGVYDKDNKEEHTDDAPDPYADDDDEPAPIPGDNSGGSGDGDGDGDAPIPGDNGGLDDEGDAPVVGSSGDEEIVGAGETNGNDPYDLTVNGFELFWRGRIIQETIDMYGNRKLTCEGDLAYLNDTVQEEYYFAGRFSVMTALDYILYYHNAQVDASKRFYVGRIDFDTFIDGQDDKAHIAWIPTMELVMNIVDATGGYLNVRWVQNEYGEWLRVLDILSQPYRECTQIAEYGKNVNDISISYDMIDFCTVILPLGMMNQEEYDESGNAYAVDPNDPYGVYDHITIAPVNNGNVFWKNANDVAKYGWICKRVEWEDIEKPKTLLRLAKEYMKYQKFEALSIEISITDMHESDLQTDYMRLLDNVRVVSKLHNIDKKFMIVKMEVNLDDVSSNTITLSADSVVPKALSKKVAENQQPKVKGLKGRQII